MAYNRLWRTAKVLHGHSAGNYFFATEQEITVPIIKTFVAFSLSSQGFLVTMMFFLREIMTSEAPKSSAN